MTQAVADALLFIALFLVVLGVALVSWPAAFITAGIGLAALAIWMGINARRVR